MKNIRDWLAGGVAVAGYTAGALIFLYSTFVTAAYFKDYITALDNRLERIETKLDRALERR